MAKYPRIRKSKDFQGIYSRWECEEVGGVWVESHVSKKNGGYTREYCRAPKNLRNDSKVKCEEAGGVWVESYIYRNGKYTGDYCRWPNSLRKDR